jgi:hypothetical protein
MTPPERATKSAGRRAGAGARGGAARGRGQRRAPARRGKRHAPHAVDGCARAARATRPRRRSMRAAYARPIPSIDPVRNGKSNIEYGKCDGILVNIDYNNGIWHIQIDYNAYSGIAHAHRKSDRFLHINVSIEYPLAALKGRAKLPGTRAFAQVGTAPCGFPLWFPHSSSSYSLAFYIDSRSRRFTTSRRGVALRLARTSPE